MTVSRNQTSPCCSPAAPTGETLAIPQSIPSERRVAVDAVHIPGGTGFVGTHTPQLPDDGESPFRKTRVKPFLIGATTVTNADFAAFVTATGYVTEAEHYGWSFVFWSDVPESVGPTQAVQGIEWWRKVDGAMWTRVNGVSSDLPPDHPVVHVSWNDAQAYATWVGGRLPTEAEWEHAARGGLADARFPWGDDEPNDTDNFPCNIWQGNFPQTNSCADGYATTAPAQSFEPNGYGLFNMVGNVWEWTAEPYRVKSLKKRARQRLETMRGYKLLKGGSFLCHRSYCYRYRIAARSGNSPESTTPHQGFRVVWDV